MTGTVRITKIPICNYDIKLLLLLIVTCTVRITKTPVRNYGKNYRNSSASHLGGNETPQISWSFDSSRPVCAFRVARNILWIALESRNNGHHTCESICIIPKELQLCEHCTKSKVKQGANVITIVNVVWFATAAPTRATASLQLEPLLMKLLLLYLLLLTHAMTLIPPLVHGGMWWHNQRDCWW